VATLILAACGGGSDTPGQAGPAATTTTATAATTPPAPTTTTAGAAQPWSARTRHGPGSRQPPDGPSAKLAAVRAARHQGYDRVVFQFEGAKVPAYRIGYVREIALGETDDQFLTLEGDALIEATFQGTASDDHRPGTQTMPDRLTPALPQVRQLGLAEDWEGVVRIGVGLDHRAGFRVLELTDPVRVVVDVAT
jgi:pyruvate/2-oxoglutarate dehydrogenase complex dihydrolipoamide acyltransferase (E2) component